MSLPAPSPSDDLVPLPEKGRRYTTTRRVRLADADPGGRLRLDAVARLLQDVGTDDFADAGLDPSSPWVARRTVVESAAWPRLGDRLAVTTWCGGLGSRWAERRSVLEVDSGARVDVASLWVFLTPDGRAGRLPAWFVDTYGAAAGGRTVSSRLLHAAPPADAGSRRWALRATDIDVLHHVNNAATWAAVEDEVARAGVRPWRAELEYHAAIEPDDDVVLRSAGPGDDGVVSSWLTVGDAIRASARVVSARR